MTNLFKRAAVCTDIHLGAKSNSVQHNQDCLDFIEWFIDTAKRANCETCFFLGDWHHHRATINVQTLHYSMQAMEKLNSNFERVFFIPGNHDTYFRDKRDIHSVEWAQHLVNVKIINDWFEDGNVVIAPWLVGDDWRTLKSRKGKYLFGHLELPGFLMNARIEMPNHDEIQSSHLTHFDHVFSGHFHQRQTKGNITYIGNCFPHNFSDAGDDERGMMILEWDKKPRFKAWPDQPRYRVYNLSDLLENPDQLLLPNSYVRVNLDVELSFEEAAHLRETLATQYNLREMSLIPYRSDIETDNTEYTNTIESVDSIIQTQIDSLIDGVYDRKLLLEIYRSL